MSKILSGNELESFICGETYLPKQKHLYTFDLTVKEIFQPQSPTAIDFGGSEHQMADKVPIPMIKRNPDDQYGWWDLKHGPKLVKFNEEFQLNDQTLIMVYPLERLLVSGAFLIPFIIESISPFAFVLVAVSSMKMKQNARIATAIAYKTRLDQ
ncbi:MAG: hypothetical protein ACXAC7_12470 [Candidatus Hodarchaeales archaeon]|jgi:hypothetical protein